MNEYDAYAECLKRYTPYKGSKVAYADIARFVGLSERQVQQVVGKLKRVVKDCELPTRYTEVVDGQAELMGSMLVGARPIDISRLHADYRLLMRLIIYKHRLDNATNHICATFYLIDAMIAQARLLQ